MLPSVISHIEHRSLNLSLNRPKKLNVLNDDIISELKNALDKAQEDSSIDRVFITGEGDKGFCAGGDVVNVVQSFKEGKYSDPGHFFKEEYAVDLKIHEFTKPIIALCHGIIMGGGLGLVNGATVRVFSPDALVSMPEITIGFFPDVGASFFLNQLERKWSLFLALTGARLDASMAHHFKLCDFIIDKEDWNEIKRSSGHEELLSLCKMKDLSSSMRDFDESEFRDLDIIDSMLSIEEFDHWAKNYIQTPNAHPWIVNSLKTYLSGSPYSAKIIWNYFLWARNKTLKECFAMDYRIGSFILQNGDFSEGVRALLMDKDKSPQWKFKSVEEIKVEDWEELRSWFSSL